LIEVGRGNAEGGMRKSERGMRKSEWERVEQRASWVEQRATGRNKYLVCIKGIEKLTENFGWMEKNL
jgi:hypothetical protein